MTAPAGRALAEEALRLPAPERAPWLSAQPDGTSDVTLTALLALAHEHLDDAPRESIAVTSLVLSLVHDRPGSATRGHVRELVHAWAWYEQAGALHRTGDLLGALRAYRQASVIFATCEGTTLELASTKCDEALVRHQIGESELALSVLATAKKVFENHHDAAGVVRCLLCEGVVHFDHDRIAAAEETFDAALCIACRVGDRKVIARLHVHLAGCAHARGDRTAALRQLTSAVDLGVAADRRRVAWGMAQILIADGAIDRGLEALEAVAEEMADAGLAVDAALVRRDIVEVLMLAGEPERASDVAPGVLDTLAKAGMFRDAMRTLALLQHASTRVAAGGWRGQA